MEVRIWVLGGSGRSWGRRIVIRTCIAWKRKSNFLQGFYNSNILEPAATRYRWLVMWTQLSITRTLFPGSTRMVPNLPDLSHSGINPLLFLYLTAHTSHVVNSCLVTSRKGNIFIRKLAKFFWTSHSRATSADEHFHWLMTNLDFLS